MLIGLGSILGTGAYVSVGLSASIAGNLLVWAILIAAVTALLNGLSSAQLAAAHPVSGGTYEYGYQFLSPLSGITAGWLFIIAKSASAATAALAVAWYISLTFNVAEWLVKLIAIGLLLLFTLFVLAGVRRTNWLNALLVTISLLGLLVFISVAFHTQPAQQQLSIEPNSLSLFYAAALMFVAFTGYGRIATMGEEITEPHRNIPKAVVLTLAIVSSLYIAVGLAILHIGGLSNFEQSNFNIAHLVASSRWRWIIVVGGVVAMSGVILNLLLGVSRVVLAMARRNDLPGALAHLSEDSQSAPAATWFAFAIMSVIALFGGIKAAWTLSAFSVLIYYGLTNIAATRVTGKQRIIPPWVSWLGLFSCFGLVVTAALATLE